MEKSAKRKIFIGTVTSDRMDKTVTVLVERKVKHPIYKKYVQKRTKFKVHDTLNRCSIGDRVKIVESRPLSKDKRWRVLQILQRAETTAVDQAVNVRGEE